MYSLSIDKKNNKNKHSPSSFTLVLDHKNTNQTFEIPVTEVNKYSFVIRTNDLYMKRLYTLINSHD